MGYVVLEGGAEFQGAMELVDRQALALAEGGNRGVGIVAAAGVPDNNQERAAANGIRWFHKLGVSNVVDLKIGDRASAEDPQTMTALSRIGLVFILGGFPGYLAQSLKHSAAWQYIVHGLQNESNQVLVGSSAGAMVLAETFYDPYQKRLMPGLGLLSGICIIPHNNRLGEQWRLWVAPLSSTTVFVCIDEQTGVITDPQTACCRVEGGGTVEIWRRDRLDRFTAGDQFDLHP